MRRNLRQGFLQKNFFPVFGLYPWECVLCRKVHLFRYRGNKRSYASEPERVAAAESMGRTSAAYPSS